MNHAKKLGLFLSMSFRISPFYLVLLFLQALVSSSQMVLDVVLMKYMIDELTGARDAQRLLYLGCIIVGMNVFMQFANKTLKREIDIRCRYVADRMQRAMAEKIIWI